jgi:hypothetical protein
MTERQGRQIDNEPSGTENILAVWRHTSQELDIVLHPTGLADECVDNILLQSRAPEHQSCALDSLLDLFATSTVCAIISICPKSVRSAFRM